MKVSLQWLKDYVDIILPPADLAHRLTMGGVEVAALREIGSTWDRDKIFVGRVLELKPHPNADRLQLVVADYGQGTITLVTGAFNMKVGDKVPVALLGARLIDGHSEKHEPIVLKPRPMRGIMSEGMVCSALELGLGDDHSGILILPDDAPVGVPLADYLGDAILDLEIKGRWDCLGMIGVAREVAAIQQAQCQAKTSLRLPPDDYPEEKTDVNDLIRIAIEDPDLCPRYSATVIRGVKIAPSPRWLQERLQAVGLRPINNVVDVTNYVMWEWNQPLHAFDYDRIRGQQIVVRRARDWATFTTLDGQERALQPDMCLIADGEGPVAIGGVMGGLESEVTEDTVNILLESANFNPVSIRRTARTLKIPSEAQRRFEKGLPPEQAPLAARRATRLILEVAGGVAARGVADCYPSPRTRQPVRFFLSEIPRLLGVTYPFDQVTGILTALGCTVTPVDQPADQPAALDVLPPFQRTDLTLPADLTEEVARLIGYDQIPETLIRGEPPVGETRSPLRLWSQRVREILIGVGYEEVLTYALTSHHALARLLPATTGSSVSKPPEPAPATATAAATHQALEAVNQRLLAITAPPLRVANPLSAEMDVLRTSAIPSLLETLSYNLRHLDRDVRIFEIGKVYLPVNDSPDGLPDERQVLTLATGQWQTGRTWGQREEIDFYTLKGVIELLSDRLGITSCHFEPASHPTFHPGRTAILIADPVVGKTKEGKEIQGVSDRNQPVILGILGEVHPSVRDNFDIKERAYVAALDFEKLVALANPIRRYTAVPRFPPVVQDIAVVVDQEIPAGRVETLIRQTGGKLLTNLTFFDLYQGDQIGPGKKSLAYSLTFQAPDRTLTDDEVANARARIERRLANELKATLRTA